MRAAGLGVGDGEGAVVAFGAVAHVAESAGTGGGAESYAVVGDGQGDQVVAVGEQHGDGGGVGVPGAVGQRFAGDGEDVVGEVGVDGGADRSGEVELWGIAELFGLAVGELEDLGLQSGGVVPVRLQLVDPGPDGADGCC